MSFCKFTPVILFLAGSPFAIAAPSIAATESPRPRQVVQRNSAGLGSIPVVGTFTDTVDSVEARAVVMAGGTNNGADTAWQVVDAAPAGGKFSGVLTHVPQGGWYQIEIRTVSGGIPGPPVSVAKVGVGDVYITAGQSNAANWGSPPATATDDRVSALHSGTGAWSLATDPLPYADGTGGSVWARLGDLLAAQENVPIGFACIAVGGTSVSQWSPLGGTLYPRFSAALSRFPVAGFKAVLWHQGESDSLTTTTSAAMATGLRAIIAQTRADDDWNVPWYVAEASYHPSSNLAQEEPITAAQREVAATDPWVFRGSATDDFHLTGKDSDGVHFNSAGLLDHAHQWRRILTGNAPISITNPSFQQNGALADGGIFFFSNSSNASPAVIGWRALNAAGDGASGSIAGYFNPNASFYAESADSNHDGVLPGMDDKHCAYLWDGPAGSHFLQTLEATLQPETRYQLTVAVGIRTSAVFGGAKVELLADGQVLKGLPLATKADLDALRGADAAGVFTDVTIGFDSPIQVVSGQNLGIRLTKIGGANTYADFDNVRLVSTPVPANEPKSVLIDFSDPGVGTSFGPLSPSYQPLEGPLGISMGYQNVGLYDGGPDHTTNDLTGANFNTFQNRPEGGYTEPSVTPQVFTFSAPVTIRSLWLSTYSGGLGTINIRAFADEAGTEPLGSVLTVTPLGGANPIRWQQFSGLAEAPYAGLTRRIEFVSSIPVSGTSYTSNIQVDDILVAASPALSPYAEWVAANWSSATNPDGQATLDPDGDSLPNGVEFHLGTNPRVGNLPPVMAAIAHSGRNWMRLSVPLASGVDHTDLSILGAPALAGWLPVSSISDGSVILTTSAALWTVDVDRELHPAFFLRLAANPVSQ